MNPDRAAIADLKILLTASEAYPAFEEAVIAAKETISASFLVFDLDTKLRSEAGKAIGKTWFDLIVHTLRRGVALTIVVSDFDPIARPKMHRGTWRTVRKLYAAAELAGPDARLRATAALHPAKTGWLPRLVISPMIMVRVWKEAQRLNRLDDADRATALREMPGVAQRMVVRDTGTVRPKLWPLPPLYPGVHHQKMAVIDGERLYIGGLDLNERRYDDLKHHQTADQTWHDVQVIADGAVAATAARHLERFLDVVEGNGGDAEPETPLLATLSHRRHGQAAAFGPQPHVSTIYQMHLAAIGRARGLIYIETQYFRDLGLARALAHAARRNPQLGLILIIPGAPEELAFEGEDGLDTQMGEWHQARCLRKIKRAFGARLFMGGAAQKRRRSKPGRDSLSGAPIIYIHAKVSIFDRREAIVSSANLNGRSMRWDTECGLHLTSDAQVAELRHRCMTHWLPEGADAAFFANDVAAVQKWRGLALSNAARTPSDRQGFIVPYNLRAAEKFGTAVPFLPPEMV